MYIPPGTNRPSSIHTPSPDPTPNPNPTVTVHDPAQPADYSYSTLEKAPFEFLIESDGDITVAAAQARCTKAEMYRALGSDSAITEVAKAANFLALMTNLHMMNLAKEQIELAFFRDQLDPSNNPDPDPDDPDDIPLGGPSHQLKDLISLFRSSSQFIAEAANAHQARSAAGRYTPPTRIPGSRAALLQASRGRPQATPTNPSPDDPTDLESGPITDAAEEMAAALRARLSESPELRDLLERALQDTDPDEGDGDGDSIDAE